jgi:hypothetical protein
MSHLGGEIAMANLSRVDDVETPSEACCTATCGQKDGYWPVLPAGVNAVHIIPIAQIIADRCGPDAASVYLIEAAASFSST